MKFSIIIPCYKVEQYLHQCVDSVLAQTFEDYEIILVDDGSPDRSPAICDEYAIKDNRVKVIHKPNGGLSDARNAGLDVAQGEYVIFLDSDDWWDDKDALRKIDSCIKESGADIVVIGMKKYFSQENRYGDERVLQKCDKGISTLSQAQLVQQYMRSNIFVGCACDKVVRRSQIEMNGLRFVVGQLSEDIEWCAKLLLLKPTIDVVSECIYVYRQGNPASITKNVSIKHTTDVVDILEKYAVYDNVCLRNYLANQYVLIVFESNLYKKSENPTFFKRLKSLWWLVEYDWYPYVRPVSKLGFLGFDAIRKLLLWYHKIR